MPPPEEVIRERFNFLHDMLKEHNFTAKFTLSVAYRNRFKKDVVIVDYKRVENWNYDTSLGYKMILYNGAMTMLEAAGHITIDRT